MKNQDLSKKHIYYYQEKTNDIIDLQDDYSIEEIGIFIILKATYFKHKGIIPIDRLCRLARFYEDQNKIIDFANKIFLKENNHYKNLDWDLEIEKINKTSNNRRKAVIERWNKSKPEAKNKQDESKTEGNVNVNVNEECIMKNENVLNEELKIKNKKTFKKPTLEQVKEYNQSRGGYVDANKFYDYYNAGNWKDQSGNKVKNWKQKFITWENKVNKNNTESNREQHTVDLINKMMNDTLINKISLKSDKILNFHTTKENKEKLQNLPENQKQEIKSILKDNFGEKTIEFIY